MQVDSETIQLAKNPIVRYRTDKFLENYFYEDGDMDDFSRCTIFERKDNFDSKFSDMKDSLRWFTEVYYRDMQDQKIGYADFPWNTRKQGVIQSTKKRLVVDFTDIEHTIGLPNKVHNEDLRDCIRRLKVYSDNLRNYPVGSVDYNKQIEKINRTKSYLLARSRDKKIFTDMIDIYKKNKAISINNNLDNYTNELLRLNDELKSLQVNKFDAENTIITGNRMLEEINNLINANPNNLEFQEALLKIVKDIQYTLKIDLNARMWDQGTKDDFLIDFGKDKILDELADIILKSLKENKSNIKFLYKKDKRNLRKFLLKNLRKLSINIGNDLPDTIILTDNEIDLLIDKIFNLIINDYSKKMTDDDKNSILNKFYSDGNVEEKKIKDFLNIKNNSIEINDITNLAADDLNDKVIDHVEFENIDDIVKNINIIDKIYEEIQRRKNIFPEDNTLLDVENTILEVKNSLYNNDIIKERIINKTLLSSVQAEIGQYFKNPTNTELKTKKTLNEIFQNNIITEIIDEREVLDARTINEKTFNLERKLRKNMFNIRACTLSTDDLYNYYDNIELFDMLTDDEGVIEFLREQYENGKPMLNMTKIEKKSETMAGFSNWETYSPIVRRAKNQVHFEGGHERDLLETVDDDRRRHDDFVDLNNVYIFEIPTASNKVNAIYMEYDAEKEALVPQHSIEDIVLRGEKVVADVNQYERKKIKYLPTPTSQVLATISSSERFFLSFPDLVSNKQLDLLKERYDLLIDRLKQKSDSLSDMFAESKKDIEILEYESEKH